MCILNPKSNAHPHFVTLAPISGNVGMIGAPVRQLASGNVGKGITNNPYPPMSSDVGMIPKEWDCDPGRWRGGAVRAVTHPESGADEKTWRGLSGRGQSISVRPRAGG